MEQKIKIRLKRPRRDKINTDTHRKQKALTIVGAFCFHRKTQYIKRIGYEIQPSALIKSIACFKSKNEIGNLHRNNKKMPHLKPLSNQ
jgi:hypothetical protein